MDEPQDIVACAETDQLYVADCSPNIHWSGCVWRVSSDGQNIEKWLPTTGSNACNRPYGLSVTSQRLLVTSLDDKLVLYRGQDATELAQISPVGLGMLQHAVETARGTFVVAHLKPRPGVSEVNDAGQVVREYGGSRSGERFVMPRHLVLDPDRKTLIADWSAHRVVMLKGRRLEMEKVVLQADRQQLVSHPLRVSFDQEAGRLHVASSTLNCLQTFRVHMNS